MTIEVHGVEVVVNFLTHRRTILLLDIKNITPDSRDMTLFHSTLLQLISPVDKTDRPARSNIEHNTMTKGKGRAV